jgi:hypothetical protein
MDSFLLFRQTIGGLLYNASFLLFRKTRRRTPQQIPSYCSGKLGGGLLNGLLLNDPKNAEDSSTTDSLL